MRLAKDLTAPLAAASPSRRAGPDAGFTLIEILVVLAILGLALGMIAGFGPPNGGGLSARAAAADLAAGLREARAQAIAGNRTVALSIDLEQHRWAIDGGAVHRLPPDGAIALLTVAGENAGTRLGRYRFFPDGSATGGKIDLADAHRHDRIDIDWLSGRVSLKDSR